MCVSSITGTASLVAYIITAANTTITTAAVPFTTTSSTTSLPAVCPTESCRDTHAFEKGLFLFTVTFIRITIQMIYRLRVSTERIHSELLRRTAGGCCVHVCVRETVECMWQLWLRESPWMYLEHPSPPLLLLVLLLCCLLFLTIRSPAQ